MGSAGDEAWAFVPRDMLPVLTRLYVAGGQPTNPFQHIFGLSSSPKLNDVCDGSCAAASDWHTVLVSGEGAGGSHYFALNISAHPAAGTPISLLWTTANDSSWTNRGGESWSVPAFGFTGASPLKSMVAFGSGYDDTPSDGQDQGPWYNAFNPMTGATLLQTQLVKPSGTVAEYGVFADGATALDATTGKAIAAYQADLGGRIWRFAAGTTNASSPLINSGVTHPYYYNSPAAMSRADGSVVLAANDSTYYDDSMNLGTPNYVPNLTVALDVAGAVAASVSLPVTGICADQCHLRNCSGCPKFSGTARPVSSPVILLNTDPVATSGAQVLFSIYQPSTNACNLGQTALVVVDVVLGSNNSLSLVQSEAKAVPGGGLSAGVMLGAGGEVVSGNSGRGTGQSTISKVSGSATPYQIGSSSTVFTAKMVGVSETSN